MPNNTRTLLAALVVAAFTTAASAKIEREVDKSFQVLPGVHVKVTTSGGDIHVSSSKDSVVKIVAKEHIRAGSEADADEVLKKLDLKIENDGNEVTASAKYEEPLGFHFGSWPPVSVDFYVTLPRDAALDLKTSGGDVVVDDVDGTVKAHTSGGNVKLGSIGGEVDASTSGGNVSLDEGRAKVRLSTSGGNVDVGHIAGPAVLKTSGGDVKVETVDNTLTAETSGGDVRAGFSGTLKGDCELETSGGTVRAEVQKGVGFQLDASTSGGEVDASGLTITIDHGGSGKSSLSGAVNGGGPLLRLHSSGGDIKIVAH
jgi:hypothetical protein